MLTCYGLFFGVLLFCVYVALPLIIVWGVLRRWPRFRTAFVALVMSIFFALNLPIQTEWERFAKLTTIQEGETALIASLHGGGFQDRKHLFMFQGSAEQFHAQAAALPWKPVELEDERITRYFSAYMTKVRQAFGAPDWTHVKIYEYFQFDDPFMTPQGQLLPRANAFLCPDATEEHWFIFWDGM